LAAEGHAWFGRVPLAIGRRKGAETSPSGPLTDHAAIKGLAAGRDLDRLYRGGDQRKDLSARHAARIGVLDGIADRARPMGAGQPVPACAAGEVDLAIAPLTMIIAAGLETEGLETGGVLPSPRSCRPT
jgi:molybdate transport system substrate-binding protein